MAAMEPIGTPLFQNNGVNMQHPGFPPAPRDDVELTSTKPQNQVGVQDLPVPAEMCLVLKSRLRKLLQREKRGNKKGKQRKLSKQDEKDIEEELVFLSFDQRKFAQEVINMTRAAMAPKVEGNLILPKPGELPVLPEQETKEKEEIEEPPKDEGQQ